MLRQFIADPSWGEVGPVYVCMYWHMYAMYICMYVLTYVCMYICMFVLTYVHIQMLESLQVHRYIILCMSACSRHIQSVYTCIHIYNVYICIWCIYIYIYIYIYKCVCVCACICICIYYMRIISPLTDKT